MRQFAVIGSGPAGFYTVEALAKAYGADAHIDLIDRLPVPYGLIRFGAMPPIGLRAPIAVISSASTRALGRDSPPPP